LRNLTDEQIDQIDDAIGEVVANQYGAVTLIVCEGHVQLIKIERSEKLSRPVRIPFPQTILSKKIGCK